MTPERDATDTDPDAAEDIARRSAALESFRALLGRLDTDMIDREEMEDHLGELA